jgi:hypothetical protein
VYYYILDKKESIFAVVFGDIDIKDDVTQIWQNDTYK